MDKINDGGPVFPMVYQGDTRSDAAGMPLRDYFAAKALQGFAAAPDMAGTPVTDVARQAYSLADAMLAARGDQ